MNIRKAASAGALAAFLLSAAAADAQQAAGTAGGATGQVSMTTVAAQLVASRTGGPGVARTSISIINMTGSAQLCIGFASTITATTAECLPAVAGASITLSTTAAIYGILPAGGAAQTVSFLELF